MVTFSSSSYNSVLRAIAIALFFIQNWRPSIWIVARTLVGAHCLGPSRSCPWGSEPWLGPAQMAVVRWLCSVAQWAPWWCSPMDGCCLSPWGLLLVLPRAPRGSPPATSLTQCSLAQPCCAPAHTSTSFNSNILDM